MAIYIGCIKAGLNAGQPDSAERWHDRREFYLYCYELMAMRDAPVRASMTIAELCDAIQDVGFGGIGSRWYRRISRADALPVLNSSMRGWA